MMPYETVDAELPNCLTRTAIRLHCREMPVISRRPEPSGRACRGGSQCLRLAFRGFAFAGPEYGEQNAQDEDEIVCQEALQDYRHRQGQGGSSRQAPWHDQAVE